MKQVSTASNGPIWPIAARATALSLTATVAAGGLLYYGVHHRAAQVFGPSVFQGCTRRPALALTFDDGPSEQSLQLLDLLSKYAVRATFFQCGLNVRRYPSIARSVLEGGHEIGNHTYSHARLCPRLSRSPNLLAPRIVADEFRRAQTIIQSEVGASPKLLRAPYGLRWFGMRAVQKELGLLGVMWTVIGHDWEWPATRIADFVLRRAGPGGIICLHDGRDIQPNADLTELRKALKQIIPVLLDRGYSFETVSELLQPTS